MLLFCSHFLCVTVIVLLPSSFYWDILQLMRINYNTAKSVMTPNKKLKRLLFLMKVFVVLKCKGHNWLLVNVQNVNLFVCVCEIIGNSPKCFGKLDGIKLWLVAGELFNFVWVQSTFFVNTLNWISLDRSDRYCNLSQVN